MGQPAAALGKVRGGGALGEEGPEGEESVADVRVAGQGGLAGDGTRGSGEGGECSLAIK